MRRPVDTQELLEYKLSRSITHALGWIAVPGVVRNMRTTTCKRVGLTREQSQQHTQCLQFGYIGCRFHPREVPRVQNKV